MGSGPGFKVRVGVVLIRNDQLLLVRQNGRDFWVFPGGTLETGETLAECAVREILEETALTVHLEKLLYVADFILPDPPNCRHDIDVFFLARYISGDLEMETGENLNDIGFFTLAEVRTMSIEPRVVIEQVLQAWSTGLEDPKGFSSPVYLGRYPEAPGNPNRFEENSTRRR